MTRICVRLPFRVVVRTWIATIAAALAFLTLAGPAFGFSKQDVTVASFDSTPLAASLFRPRRAGTSGRVPGGDPHARARRLDRSSMSALAQSMGLVGENYVVLTFDARGHGQSGGLIGIDGPNEIADTRTVFSWLAARPDVADAKIGALGISLGGGAAWNSLAAGVPWAAVEVSNRGRTSRAHSCRRASPSRA